MTTGKFFCTASIFVIFVAIFVGLCVARAPNSPVWWSGDDNVLGHRGQPVAATVPLLIWMLAQIFVPMTLFGSVGALLLWAAYATCNKLRGEK
jgi:hypothetical protein